MLYVVLRAQKLLVYAGKLSGIMSITYMRISIVSAYVPPSPFSFLTHLLTKTPPTHHLPFQLSPNFSEARYAHWSSIASTTHLLQVLFTSESGNTSSSLVGEEFLYWLNTHYVAPSSEEGPELDSHDEPWLEEGFWTFLVRYLLFLSSSIFSSSLSSC